MIRVFLVHLVLFLIPFAAYAIWLVAVRRAALAGPENWQRDRVMTMAIAGLVITTLGFLVLGAFTGAPPGSTYVPAEIRDGQIVPGHYE